MRWSQHSASSSPPPSAYPVTAATVGLGMAATASSAAARFRCPANASAYPESIISLMSAPAAKTFSPPYTTTARTSERSEASSAAVRNSRWSTLFRALSGGRCSRMVPTPAVASSVTNSPTPVSSSRALGRPISGPRRDEGYRAVERSWPPATTGWRGGTVGAGGRGTRWRATRDSGPTPGDSAVPPRSAVRGSRQASVPTAGPPPLSPCRAHVPHGTAIPRPERSNSAAHSRVLRRGARNTLLADWLTRNSSTADWRHIDFLHGTSC